ncbi:hypothetical protein LOTGIDRAFT_121674 [Lottia gigantea]|uniref:Uncharacterized protein n=1 Tax=Lottia gigantea TaxID=225164 RepID=V4A5I0_LOTGI|nr:hypothetical protein LOTGIDRAFT_121674 [Lottia gigantea]ESO91942.1 hypothetical protein LOTGIDRAFT_121674 [Lottia gigantea]
MREIPGLPPGPSFLPLVGNVIDMSWTYRKRKHKYFEEMEKKFGPVYRLYFGRQLLILFNDVESVKEALVEKRDIFTDRPSEAFWVAQQIVKHGAGIVWSNGQHWESTRRTALQTLRDLGVGKQSIEEKILEETEYMLTEITRLHRKPLHLDKLMAKGASNVISTVVFGKRFDYDDPEFNKILSFIKMTFDAEGPISPLNMLPQIRFLPYISAMIENCWLMIDEINVFLSKTIDEHKKTLNKENPGDFIDVGLTTIANSKTTTLTDGVLMCTILDLFIAGSDTTATTLDWAFLYLIHKPDVQTKCQKEIENVVGFGRRVKWADKPTLVYCAATLMEVQRFSTVAIASLPHTATEDTEIKGFLIPRGSIVFADIRAIHYDENLWENPREFNPERFIDGDGKIIQNSNLLPFSLGPRICPGASLAKMELFLMFCNILQRYSFSKTDDTELDLDGVSGITLSPKPYTLHAKPRCL